ncbi:MAG: hemerythrin domain-containing protein [Acidimicrobiales bacterium]
MTMTQTEAFDAMLQHHRILSENVDACAAALSEAVQHEDIDGPAVASLVAYLADEIFPHAVAEEQSIYRNARTRPRLSDIVDAVIAEHKGIAREIESLPTFAVGGVISALTGE